MTEGIHNILLVFIIFLPGVLFVFIFMPGLRNDMIKKRAWVPFWEEIKLSLTGVTNSKVCPDCGKNISMIKRENKYRTRCDKHESLRGVAFRRWFYGTIMPTLTLGSIGLITFTQIDFWWIIISYIILVISIRKLST